MEEVQVQTHARTQQRDMGQMEHMDKDKDSEDTWKWQDGSRQLDTCESTGGNKNQGTRRYRTYKIKHETLETQVKQ